MSAARLSVPARLLADVVSGLPNDKISIALNTKTQTTNLLCAQFETNIKGMEANEFPIIVTIADHEPSITFPPDLLREVIGQVAIAAATDDTRPVLAGVLMRLTGTTATFAAADGFRLAVRTIELPEPVRAPQDVIIPARALLELARIIGDVEGNVEITITPGGGQILFHTETIDVVSRLIEGKFPDFERIIPAQSATRTVLDRQELAKAVKLASYFANVPSNTTVKLTIESGGELAPGKLTISANAAEVGDNTGTLDGMIHGEGGLIALNVRFLAQAVESLGTPQIALETQTPQHPAVFKPVGADGYLHLLMPMTAR